MVLALLGTIAALAPVASARQMYVTEERGGVVSAVDLETGAVSPVAAGVGDFTFGIAITPDGRHAYVAGNASGEVTVIDTVTDTVSARIALGAHTSPMTVAIAPDGRYAYVAENLADRIAVIDTATDAVTATVPLPAGSAPRTLAVSPDGRRLYVVGTDSAEVTVIDTATDTVSTTIPLGTDFLSVGLAITPDGKQLYAVGLGSTTGAFVIDTATDSVSGTITTASGGLTAASGIAVSPDGRRAYLTDLVGKALLVVDTATNQVTGTIPIPSSIGAPSTVVLSPDGTRAYVGRLNEPGVSVVDTVDEKVLAPLEGIGGTVEGLAIVPDQPPIAALAPASGVPGSPVSLDAAASTDPDGTIAAYGWSFGDGRSAPDGGPTVSHTYAAPGTYPASVTLTDQEGCSTELVFTGQTAYCNGSAAARGSIQVPVKPRPVPQPSPVDPGPASPPPPAESRPVHQPSAFLLRKVTHNPHNGTVRMRLWLSGSGALRVRGRQLRPIHRRVGEARTLTVVVRPRRKAMPRLRRHRHLRSPIRITFTPAAGPSRTVSRRVTFRYRRRAIRR